MVVLDLVVVAVEVLEEERVGAASKVGGEEEKVVAMGLGTLGVKVAHLVAVAVLGAEGASVAAMQSLEELHRRLQMDWLVVLVYWARTCRAQPTRWWRYFCQVIQAGNAYRAADHQHHCRSDQRSHCLQC